MKTLSELWQARLSQFARSMSRYSRLIVNDHMALILLVVFGFFSLYYQDLFRAIQANPPAYLALVMTLLPWGGAWVGLTWGRPILLTYEPDKSYLFVRGHEWHQVWKRGVALGSILPSLLLVLVTILLLPFMQLAFPAWSLNQLVLFAVYLALAHYLIAYLDYARFFEGALAWPLKRWQYALVMGGFLALALWMPPVWGLALLVGMLGVTFLYAVWVERRLSSGGWIHFEALVAQEERRRASLYRWLSLFAEVPQQIPPIKRRAYLDRLVTYLSRFFRHRYAYLYLRHLVRNTAYSGIWLRVLVFFSLLILGSRQPWLWLLAGSMSTVLTLVQLMPLIHLPLRHPLERLYPQDPRFSLQPFRQVISLIIGGQVLVYTGLVAWLGQDLAWLGLCLLVWLLVAGLGLYLYLPFWLRRHPLDA